MKSLLTIGLLLMLAAGCAYVAAVSQANSPVVIPVQNPSFEQGDVGWQFGHDTGVTELNGKSVAYAGGRGTFSQVLNVSPAEVQVYPNNPNYFSTGVYTLKFSVQNYFTLPEPVYPGYYTAKVSFGEQELCETSGWGTEFVTQVILVCPSPKYLVNWNSLPDGGLAQGKSNLVVAFTVDDGSENGGWTVLFDDVSMTFTN